MRAVRTVPFAALLLAAAACSERTFVDPGRPEQPAAEPTVTIVHPPRPTSGIPRYLAVTRFRWESSGETPALRVRHFVTQALDTTGAYNPLFDLPGDLSANPARYDTLWSPWIDIDAPGEAGRSALVGEDENLPLPNLCYFAVQAMDAKGNVTHSFDTATNMRAFFVTSSSGPALYVTEPYISDSRFIGSVSGVVTRRLPPGIPLRLRWKAIASNFNEIAGYRFGWDIPDLSAWDAPFLPGNLQAPEAAFFAGAHTFVVEAVDLSGALTRGRIRIEIVPWPMDRDLLWVDDYFAPQIPPDDMSSPSESEHDDFWTGLCSRAPGFDPVRDVFDTYLHDRAPSLEELGRYRCLVWTFSTAQNNRWSGLVRFTAETMLESVRNETPNLPAIFLRAGGSVWTAGRSDFGGGLAAVLNPQAQSFPIDLGCEIAGPDPDCTDRSGARSMAYEAFCVTVIDKVQGRLRSDSRMPTRRLAHHDVMRGALRANDDPLTAAAAGLPARLDLREEVTAEGAYFCTDSTCTPGGFTHVEVYDPAYWLAAAGTGSRHCFHPVYRMRAASAASVLDGQPVAVWVPGYRTDAAPSIHFGFPLWFFRHESVDSIADVVFSAWGIR